MPRTDYSKLTTEDLLEIIPATETREWEYKAADIFDKANFGKFKAERLGKIVSSFANSGGGQLLLGKRDDGHVFEKVPTHQGNTSMEDHLAQVITPSVTPHYKDFEIFRVPISGRAGESVLVVDFHDSHLAPFQSNADTNYFWRLPGSVKPAPHFHLELLRSRTTRAVLKIHKIVPSLQRAIYDRQHNWLYVDFDFVVQIENISMQSATSWGIKIDSERMGWTSTDAQRELVYGACVGGNPPVLLPTQGVSLLLKIHHRIRDLREWQYFDSTFTPVSQNFVGEPVRWSFPTDFDKRFAENAFNNELKNLLQDFDPQRLQLLLLNHPTQH